MRSYLKQQKLTKYSVVSMLSIFLCIITTKCIANENKTTIVIGFENLDYAPLFSTGEKGEIVGFIPELVTLVASEYQLNVTLESFPVGRLKSEINKGSIDIQFPDSPNWQTDNKPKRAYSLPVLSYTDSYFSAEQSSKIELVATPLGFTIHAKPSFSIQVATPTRVTALFKMLRIGRVDAIYLNEVIANHYAAANSLQITKRDDLPSDIGFYHFSASNKHPFIDHVNQFITSYPNKFNQLLSKYKLASEHSGPQETSRLQPIEKDRPPTKP